MERVPMPFLVAFFLLYHSHDSLNNLPGFCAAAGDSFAFSGFAGANLTRDGTAKITREGLLELTNNDANAQGHAFHPTPVQFKDSSNGTVQSFSLTFVFAILSDPASSDMSSDGMAFVIAHGKDFSSASPAQYLGLLNSQSTGPTNASNHIFAVELDTIQNEEFKDIDGNHVGVDINTLSSVYSHSAAFYDDKDGTLKNLNLFSRDGEEMQVWVDYDGETKQINVTLAPMGVEKPSKPLISNTSDLSAVTIKEAYVGFTAATGPIKSRHYVLAWSFAMNRLAPAIDFKKMPKLPNSGHKTLTKALAIALPIATSVILAICIAILVILQRKQAYAELREDWEVEFGPHRFSYKCLFHATEGFKSKHLLGIGGFGRVYKGVLQKSKSEVAVKRVSHESWQGMKEFIAEVVSMGRLRHKNIVQLLGYCRRKEELLLVYDYMPNGSLDKYLHGNTIQTFDWAQRFHIIQGVASGLLYLHEDWEQVVIHRDIKASNVLLDREMNGRLGDFGLARLYDHGTEPQTTHVVGTMGYIAPELTRMGRASTLTDVFAFGVFLLEVTCGRRPITQQDGQDVPFMLVDWVLEHWQKGSLPNVVDTRLLNNYNVDEACLALKLGLLCSHPLPNARPNMRQVVQYLDGNAIFPEHILTEITPNGGVQMGANYVVSPSSTSFSTITVDLSGGR